jgi:hypothetical protein
LNGAPTVAIIVGTVMSIGFTLLGIYGLRHPDRLADFFRRRGTEIYGKKIADRVYTTSNQRWALIPFVIIGPIFVVIGVVNIVSRLFT